MNATHAYIGTTSCGCTVAAVVDDSAHLRDTAKAVFEFIAEGLTVTRIQLDQVRQLFHTCPHQTAVKPTGKRLYEVHLFGLAYVLAQDEEHAEEIITDQDYSADQELTTSIHPAICVHPDWINTCPYRDDDDWRTCQEILNMPGSHEEADATQLSLGEEDTW